MFPLEICAGITWVNVPRCAPAACVLPCASKSDARCRPGSVWQMQAVREESTCRFNTVFFLGTSAFSLFVLEHRPAS